MKYLLIVLMLVGISLTGCLNEVAAVDNSQEVEALRAELDSLKVEPEAVDNWCYKKWKKVKARLDLLKEVCCRR